MGRRRFTYNGREWSVQAIVTSDHPEQSHPHAVRFTSGAEELIGATRLPLEQLSDADLEHALANALMRQLLEEDDASYGTK